MARTKLHRSGCTRDDSFLLARLITCTLEFSGICIPGANRLSPCTPKHCPDLMRERHISLGARKQTQSSESIRQHFWETQYLKLEYLRTSIDRRWPNSTPRTSSTELKTPFYRRKEQRSSSMTFSPVSGCISQPAFRPEALRSRRSSCWCISPHR